jgi:hypothetical protein
VWYHEGGAVEEVGDETDLLADLELVLVEVREELQRGLVGDHGQSGGGIGRHVLGLDDDLRAPDTWQHSKKVSLRGMSEPPSHLFPYRRRASRRCRW